MHCPKHLVVLVSGNGSTLQSIIDACREGRLDASISCVISSNPAAYALERADRANIMCFPLDYRKLGTERYNFNLENILSAISPDLICLAGYLKILPGTITRKFDGRVVNIHPSLLPKFGGSGMYGDRVHAAVLQSRETQTGCTVHYVTDEVDAGPVILSRKVPVLPGDTVETLRERVHMAEIEAYPEAIRIALEML